MNLPNTEIIEQAQAVWGPALQPAGCPACRRAFLVEAARLGQPCPQCAAGRLEAQPVFMRAEPPELLLPFARRPADVRASLEAYLKPVWLRPADLDAGRLAQRLTPLFWPMWLVDADLAGGWQAELGFDYQVKSSQESYQGGQWTTREVLETRARWEPRCGEIHRRYHNVAAPALTEQAALTALVGEYPLAEARPYQAADLTAGVRVPDLPPESAWPAARAQIEQLAAADCQAAAGAQHVRQIKLPDQFENQNWTQLLLPLYATYYTDDDGRPQVLVINGRTGRVGGRRRASARQGRQWAWGLAAGAAGLLVLGLLIAVAGALFPPLMLLGGLLSLAAFALGAGAVGPLFWVWQWNRSNG